MYAHQRLPLCCRFGDIGAACARLAKAFQMRVLGLRRRTQITEEEAGLVVRSWAEVAMQLSGWWVEAGWKRGGIQEELGCHGVSDVSAGATAEDTQISEEGAGLVVRSWAEVGRG